MIPALSGSDHASLQSTISAASATNTHAIIPHHPITCAADIFYDEDGTFRCIHATAPPDDDRSQMCVNHSVSLLIIELAMQL